MYKSLPLKYKKIISVTFFSSRSESTAIIDKLDEGKGHESEVQASEKQTPTILQSQKPRPRFV